MNKCKCKHTHTHTLTADTYTQGNTESRIVYCMRVCVCVCLCVCAGAAVVQEVEKSFSNQKVASSIPCRSVLEQDTEPLIAPDVQCAISVNVKCVYIVSRTYVSRFG